MRPPQLSRSYQLDHNNKTVAVIAAVVGVLAVCGILAIVFWYLRGNSAFLSTEEEDFADSVDKPPLSAVYVAPPPRVYAERWASVAGSMTPSTAQPSASTAKGSPNLVISIPTDEPPPLGRRWELKRVPVPRLSRLPSPSLTKIRVALRTPRQQDFKGLPRSPRLKPKPKPRQTPSPLPINPKESNQPPSPDLPSGFPSALPSATPLTSRLKMLMNRIQHEYNV